ncbi:substrate-binding periplasmic protein [Kiloniella laminariae]|uniref:substrate-binding periplasmic protein n=1 Tax=Kiloniella laminariae TaxID=454162 RepID=UPI00038011BF|nr:transporter substrate-binding domain-containing protein [Kiloniella laminariae]
MQKSGRFFSTVFALLATGFIAGYLSKADARELKFITLETAPWASFEPGSDRPIGAFPEVVRELERRSGHQIQISLRPFARINQDLESGDQDCTIILWSESRVSIVEKGAEVYQMPFGVIARKGVVLSSYDDLKPLTISLLRGLKITPEFDSDTSLQKEYDKDYQIGLLKIAHQRLDAIAGAIPTIFYMAKQENYPDLLDNYLVMKKIPIVLQCSRKSPNLDVMPELNKVIETMGEDGTLTRLLNDNSYF